MTEPALRGKSDFLARLDELPALKTFPAVASRLLTMCEDDDVNVSDLVEIIRCDPSLSIQLLRIANSPVYGFGGQIKSLEHGAVVLGFRSVKNLAVSVAASSVFSAGNSALRYRESLWQHSLACAVIARRLATCVSEIDPDEAFIAGMVHDVGKLVFFDLAADHYSYDPTKLVSVPTSEQEIRDFGVDHGQVGNRCGMEWGLPEEINEAIAHHHDPRSAQWARELVETVYAANRLAKSWGVGPQADDIEGQGLDAVPDVELGISEEQLIEIRASVPEEFDELSKVFLLEH